MAEAAGVSKLIYHKRMHSSRELRSSSFEIRVAGRLARLEELFEGFGEQDRLGVVMSRPCAAVGASALISATVTAFYDIQRTRGPDFFVYPDYYLFHVGRPLGDHARLDVWPRRKEVVVPDDPDAILEAIDDRAITRLLVEEDATGRDAAARDAELAASARGRIVTCLAYSPTGRVARPDVRIASNPVTEGYVEAILDPEARIADLRAEAGGAGAAARIAAIETRLNEVEPEVRRRILASRRGLLEDGVPVETYRRIAVDEALALLGRRAVLDPRGARAPRPGGGPSTSRRSRSSAGGRSITLERSRSWGGGEAGLTGRHAS
jgi:hypothetical protein